MHGEPVGPSGGETAFLSSPVPTPQAVEGLEDTDLDLVAFAQALTNAGVIMYGAGWCPHCTAQKELFQDGGDFLPFVEVTNPDRSRNQVALDNNITQYPTWVFQDGSRLVGEQDLATLSQKAGIAIPRAQNPFVAPIADSPLLAGSPLMVPINGYDPQNGALTYTVTSDNPGVIPTLQTGGRSLRVKVNGFGDMVFYLFEDKAPRATSRIISLAESGFHSNIEFHRVINNFVIQGGDPTGTGSGGSNLSDFDDQFHVDLQHNRTGLLSMAKTQDDTNDSQFFITEGAQRHLDFNHTIFGVLVEGEKNRDNISNTATGSGDKPTTAVRMNSTSVFQDQENAVVMLKTAPGVTSGSANITITARDPDNNEYTRTFRVNIANDTVNGAPFLADIPEIQAVSGQTTMFDITAIDVEGDPVTFWDQGDLVAAGRYNPVQANPNLQYNINRTTGRVELTPLNGLVGTYEFTVAVGANATTPSDYQVVTVNITAGETAPPTVDLATESDTGASSTDNITNHETPTIVVSGVTHGAKVRLYVGDQVLVDGTASGNTISFTVDADALSNGGNIITATQEIAEVESDRSPVLFLTIDRTPPPAFTNTAPNQAYAAIGYEFLPLNPQGGLAYSLSGAPAGMTIDAATGELDWRPTSSQLGAHSFELRATDIAGNVRAMPISLTVSANPWRNPANPSDVNNSGGVTIDDAMALIDYIHQEGFKALSAPGEGGVSVYMDVNGDGQISPLDVLLVVNGLVSQSASFASQSAPEQSFQDSADEALVGLAMNAALGEDAPMPIGF